MAEGDPLITVVQSDDDLPGFDVDGLIAAGVYAKVDFGGSGGLFHTPRVKGLRWLQTARVVVSLEAGLGVELAKSREALDRIRRDPWCQIAVDWEDM